MATRPGPLIARGAALIVLCLLVGLFLASLGVTPHGLLHDTGRTLQRAFRLAVDAVDWAVPYTLLGAIVVVPLLLLRYALRFARRR